MYVDALANMRWPENFGSSFLWVGLLCFFWLYLLLLEIVNLANFIFLSF